jgi:hypothetical protein
LEIYFSDLTKEAQAEVLSYYGIKSPKEMNWDTYPMFELNNYNCQ